VGRRHLSRVSALVALVLIFAAPAGAAVHWRVLAKGPASGSSYSATSAYVALDRAETARFSSRLTGAASDALARVSFRTDALVAIFGEFGCQDQFVSVTSVEQHGATLAVKLLQRRPTPGTVQCTAIYPTYRFLGVAKSSLQRPYPTRATVSLARA
jgi:hypothetical protein